MTRFAGSPAWEALSAADGIPSGGVWGGKFVPHQVQKRLSFQFSAPHLKQVIPLCSDIENTDWGGASRAPHLDPRSCVDGSIAIKLYISRSNRTFSSKLSIRSFKGLTSAGMSKTNSPSQRAPGSRDETREMFDTVIWA